MHDLQSMSFPIDVVAHVQAADVHELLDDAFDFMLEEARMDMNIGLNDRVAIVISSVNQNGQPMYIRIPFTRFSDLSTVEILNQIVHALQSYEELGTNIEVRIVVHPVTALGGVAGPGAMNMSRGDMGVLVRSKRGIVEINPPHDVANESKHCFEQWIVIGLAHLVEHQLIQPIEKGDLRIGRSTYSSLVRSRHKFVNRKRMAARLSNVVDMSAPSEALLP